MGGRRRRPGARPQHRRRSWGGRSGRVGARRRAAARGGPPPARPAGHDRAAARSTSPHWPTRRGPSPASRTPSPAPTPPPPASSPTGWRTARGRRPQPARAARHPPRPARGSGARPAAAPHHARRRRPADLAGAARAGRRGPRDRLVGAYAVVRADQGRLTLVRAAQRGTLGAGPIPTTGVPAELRDLWGKDLAEWAGLNLSPHFPWTGQLVAAGWKQRTPDAPLDYVVAIDQHAVAALLAGTGPVTVHGAHVDATNAVAFLSRDIYLHYPAPAGVDAVTAELGPDGLLQVAAGHLDLASSCRRWPRGSPTAGSWSGPHGPTSRRSSRGQSRRQHPAGTGTVRHGRREQRRRQQARRLPQGAHQLHPGRCVRCAVGNVGGDADNTAPRRGHRRTVDRGDLLGRAAKPDARSNRILLDLYGPVAGQAPVVTLDGAAQEPMVGAADRGTRCGASPSPSARAAATVRAVSSSPSTSGGRTPRRRCWSQPMAIPATTTRGAAPACAQ